jgi:hypothetical protein
LSSQRIRIQNFLRQKAMGAEFPVVVYDAAGLASVATEQVAEQLITKKINPQSATCNEVQEAYEPDRNMGRRVQDRRSQWLFHLNLKFNQEVLLEDFVQDFLDNPPMLPRTEDLDHVMLRLVRCDPLHPPRQQSSTGTQATLTIVAIPSRR